ncbi:MAG: M48 family metalloprotease [Planctomycetota bacterium]|jgi:predicted Zn-dependent protease
MRRSLFLAFVAVMALLAGCSTNPVTGRRQLLLVSPAETDAMGAAAMPELIQQYGGEVESAELRAYVRDVGDRLVAHVEGDYGRLEWSFTVLDSEVINAFALPGGRVFISRGLLAEFENEAQVAGVLGHEIGHVTARHVDERISHALSVEFGLSVLGAMTESDLAVAGAQLFGSGYLLSFNRNQETEADKLGLRYMTKAGYDPAGMLQVLDVLETASEGGPPEFMSTHPHPETRIEYVTERLAGRYAFTQDNPEYSLHARRFRRRAKPYL